MKRLLVAVSLLIVVAVGWYARPVYGVLAEEDLTAQGHRSLVQPSRDDLLAFWVDKAHLPYFKLNQLYRVQSAETDVVLSLSIIAAGRLRPTEYKLGFRVVSFTGADSLPVDWYRLKRLDDKPILRTSSSSLD